MADRPGSSSLKHPTSIEFPCTDSECTAILTSSYLLKQHILFHHGHDHNTKLCGFFHCRYCEHKTKDRRDFESHVRMHTGDLLRCPECGKGFAYRHSLNRHRKDKHGYTLSRGTADKGNSVSHVSGNRPSSETLSTQAVHVPLPLPSPPSPLSLLLQQLLSLSLLPSPSPSPSPYPSPPLSYCYSPTPSSSPLRPGSPSSASGYNVDLESLEQQAGHTQPYPSVTSTGGSLSREQTGLLHSYPELPAPTPSVLEQQAGHTYAYPSVTCNCARASLSREQTGLSHSYPELPTPTPSLLALASASTCRARFPVGTGGGERRIESVELSPAVFNSDSE